MRSSRLVDEHVGVQLLAFAIRQRSSGRCFGMEDALGPPAQMRVPRGQSLMKRMSGSLPAARILIEDWRTDYIIPLR